MVVISSGNRNSLIGILIYFLRQLFFGVWISLGILLQKQLSRKGLNPVHLFSVGNMRTTPLMLWNKHIYPSGWWTKMHCYISFTTLANWHKYPRLRLFWAKPLCVCVCIHAYIIIVIENQQNNQHWHAPMST